MSLEKEIRKLREEIKELRRELEEQRKVKKYIPYPEVPYIYPLPSKPYWYEHQIWCKDSTEDNVNLKS